METNNSDEQISHRCDVCGKGFETEADEVMPETGWRCETCEPIDNKRMKALRADISQCDPRLSMKRSNGAALRTKFDYDKSISSRGCRVHVRTVASNNRDWPSWAKDEKFRAYLCALRERNVRMMALKHEAMRLSVAGWFPAAIIQELGSALGEKPLKTQKARDAWRFLPWEEKEAATDKYRRGRVEAILNGLRSRGDRLWSEYTADPKLAEISIERGIQIITRSPHWLSAKNGQPLAYATGVDAATMQRAAVGDPDATEFVEEFRAWKYREFLEMLLDGLTNSKQNTLDTIYITAKYEYKGKTAA